MTLQDLLKSHQANVAFQSSDAATISDLEGQLDKARAAKAQSDADVAASAAAFASAIKAKGGIAVDRSASPLIEYTTSDGTTFAAKPVASLDDLLDEPAAPAGPAS
jgi:hypothetical protein